MLMFSHFPSSSLCVGLQADVQREEDALPVTETDAPQAASMPGTGADDMSSVTEEDVDLKPTREDTTATELDGSSCVETTSQAHTVRAKQHLRSFTSAQLAEAIRPQFEAHRRSWRIADVRAAVEPLDAGAMGICGAILRKLRGAHVMSAQTSTRLVQGLAVCLRRRGFGIALHTASAANVREQALELARKKYYGQARKRGQFKLDRFTRESVAEALDAIQETVTAEDGTEKTAEYLVGWTAVPPEQMGEGHASFPPVDAIDCASSRGQAGGVIVVRGKKDGNRRLHAASLSHMLAAEGDLSVGVCPLTSHAH